MKKTFIAIMILLFFSCSTTKNKVSVEEQKNELLNAEENNKIKLYNELRFSNIKSALDTQKLMYLEYGFWDENKVGLNQQNISQKIWKNIDLFNDGKKFTIIADGKETTEEYYASIIIFDSENNDCLDLNYPLKEKLTILLQEKMMTSKDKAFNYMILRKNKKKQ